MLYAPKATKKTLLIDDGVLKARAANKYLLNRF